MFQNIDVAAAFSSLRSLLLTSLFMIPCSLLASPVPAEVNALNRDIWTRFVAQPQGLLLDYILADGTASLPTAEEATQGRPNAISWWTPMENGAFFNGLYLDGIVRRWGLTHAPEDREKAVTLVHGLTLCATVGSTPGFIARGVFADGKSHYGIGSDDQTSPWFYGLWRYLQSGIPSETERKELIAKMVEVAEAVQAAKWHMPCDSIGDLAPGQMRGSWAESNYRSATRLLFVTRILFELTGDPRWEQLYNRALTEPMKDGQRLEIVTRGMPGEWLKTPDLAKNQLWIYVNPQAMVRELLALEKRPEIRACYAASLQATADACRAKIKTDVSRLGSAPFLTDWRVMNELWRPQPLVGDAVKLAMEQLHFWKNQGKTIEAQSVREPLCAAWITFLSSEQPDPEALRQFSETFASIPWEKLSSSVGFFGECAWYASHTPSVK